MGRSNRKRGRLVAQSDREGVLAFRLRQEGETRVFVSHDGLLLPELAKDGANAVANRPAAFTM